eukprot:scaffold49_cov82-Skeletonema_dohrnii-CCMP3373.AAC.2
MTHANDLMPKDGMRWAGLPDLDLDSSSDISCLDGSIVTCFLFLGLRESNLLSLSVGQISSVQRRSKKFEAEKQEVSQIKRVKMYTNRSLEVSMLPSLSRVPTLRERGNYRSDKILGKMRSDSYIRALEFDTGDFGNSHSHSSGSSHLK